LINFGQHSGIYLTQFLKEACSGWIARCHAAVIGGPNLVENSD
jgi:hypothetical protein